MKLNRILFLFLVIGLVFASFIVLNRGNVENGYKNVEITLDYDELLKMSAQEDKDVEYFLKQFKSMDVASVSLNELTLNSLMQRDEYDIDTYMEGTDLVVSAQDSIIGFILDGFERKLDKDQIEIIDKNTFKIKGDRKDYINNQTNVTDVDGKYIGKKTIAEGSKYEYLGIGFLQSDIDKIKEAGLEVNLRPIYVSGYDDKKTCEYYFDLLDSENINPDYIIFAGSEVLGWDKCPDYVNSELKNRNIVIGMIENSVQREHVDQKGLQKLVEKSDYNATRVFNIWDWIQIRYDYDMPLHHHGEEIVNSMYRAVTERNTRVMYFKPFYDKNKKEYVTDMSIYKQRFSDFEKRLEPHKLKLGKVNSMKPYHPNRFMQIPIAIAIIAACLILLDNLFGLKNKYIYTLFALGSFASIVLFGFSIKLELVVKLFALLGSIAMPSLAMIFVLGTVKELLVAKLDISVVNIIIKAIIVLFIASFISFMGVLFEVSMLSDIKFLLELDIFKGVKLSQMAPIFITFVIYIYNFGYKRKEIKKGFYIDEAKTFLWESIKIWQVIAVAIFLVMGIVFIARTGHETNIKPAMSELFFRNMLELLLLARPRTKAVLFAHPAMILLIYCAVKNYKWAILPLSLAVVIGQSNIVNTFSHIRAPLYLSYARTNYELLFGMIIGAIAVVIINFIISKFDRRNKNA